MSAARPGIISSDEVSVEAGSGVLDADVLRTRRLLEPLREQVVQHWQDAQTVQGHVPDVFLALEQLEVVFEGLLQGRVPEGLLGELTLQAATHGVDPGIWAARIGSLIDTPLELIAELPWRHTKDTRRASVEPCQAPWNQEG